MAAKHARGNVFRYAFTESEVVRITGITSRQLRYWDKTDFFSPSLFSKRSNEHGGQFYSFRDVSCLKVIGRIRNEAQVPLPRLREAKEELRAMGEEFWIKTTLYVLKRRIVFYNPEIGAIEDVVSKQKVLDIPLKLVSEDVEREVLKSRARKKSSLGKVSQDRSVRRNAPVISGTRIPVEAVKSFHAEGYSIDSIIMEYPQLTRKDVEAAIAYKAAA